MQVLDLTNKKFGMLTALSIDSKNYAGQTMWLCICECGKKVVLRAWVLKTGNTKSCGCGFKKRNLTHGLSRHPIYQVWALMKSRCSCRSTPNFKNYGGRGISVCQSWSKDFKCFYKWALSNGYKNGLQLDRRNNNGNYTPKNCRFVTTAVNSTNKRNTLWLTINNDKRSVSEWAKVLNIQAWDLRYRYNKSNKKHFNSITDAKCEYKILDPN